MAEGLFSAYFNCSFDACTAADCCRRRRSTSRLLPAMNSHLACYFYGAAQA